MNIIESDDEDIPTTIQDDELVSSASIPFMSSGNQVSSMNMVSFEFISAGDSFATINFLIVFDIFHTHSSSWKFIGFKKDHIGCIIREDDPEAVKKLLEIHTITLTDE